MPFNPLEKIVNVSHQVDILIFWIVHSLLLYKFLETEPFIPLEKIVKESHQVDILMLGIFGLATKCFISNNCLTGNNSDKT